MSRRYDHPVRDLVDVRVGRGRIDKGRIDKGYVDRAHVDEAHVDVRRDDESSRPSQFVWRGRLYVVRGVLAHWVEVGAWWRVRLPDGLPARVDEHGREVWRVEALAGRTSTPGVYDLAYDEAAASWTLARSHD